MLQTKRLEKMISENRGIVQTGEAVKAGISKPVFYKYIKEHVFEQVSHGIYVSPNAWTDSMFILSLRCKQAVFSHETALFIHELTDREPVQYSITVKTGYNPSRLKKDQIKVYTIKKDLYMTGVINLKTTFGNTVRVYDMERTICDIVRSRNGIEIQSYQDAIKQYLKRKDKNLQLLMQYAEKFHVEKLLNQYLEVLL